MATENPIRMLEPLWNASGMIPNRSGSAPPNMEGSLATLENLRYDRQFGGPKGALISYSSVSHYSFTSGFENSASSGAEKQSRLTPLSGSSDNFLHLYRSSLSTHKEESEDDRSPMKVSDEFTDRSFIGHARNVAEDIKDEFTCMSSPTNDKPNAVCCGNNTRTNSGDQHITYLQTGINALNITGEPKAEKSFVQHQMHQPITALPYQNPIPQLVSHVTGASYIIPNQVIHSGKISSIEAQPVLHSSGFTPPLYATPNPYYAGIQQPGVVYPPQYNIVGYSYNTGVVPLAFDDVNTHHGTWGNGSQGVDMRHMNRFYAPLGFAPPVMQFNPSYGDFYNVHGQVDPLGSDFASALHDYRPQNEGVRGAFSGIDYATANSTNTGFFTHITNSALASPVLPGSPMGGTGSGFSGVRSVGSPHSGRSASPYGSWHGHRGFENFNHHKRFSYLEELKSGKGRRFELSDIVGHVVDFSVDQHGSRFIQQKLENCSAEDKQSVFEEVLPHASKLMSDVFGNYVIQKFCEYGTPDQRRDLANALKGQMLQLSLQMYGCRVIQKILDVIEVDQKTELVNELDGHVMRCVRDQNGNHVVQKCIESIPLERIGFVISSFRGQVASLSMHPYGCRVIQRILERCTAELETQFIVDEILESVCTLAQDQYGNYVTQHVLEKGKPNERLQIIKNLSGKVVQMSQHKFASNVIEKCLDHGGPAGRELLIGEVIGMNEGNDNLLVMMKDQYANYVVQKILETCTDSQRDLLIGRIAVHLHGLKKYTYGKHIVSRFEKLFGEMQAPSS